MMNIPRFTGTVILLIASSPLLAAAFGGRATEGEASSADAVAFVNVLPEMPLAALNLSHNMHLYPEAAKEAHLVDGSGPSLAEQLPVLGAVRRRTGDRFNTTDSSHPNDFAICYRILPRMGLQVIPGDPTPGYVKLPVSTLANNKGVTVGMTLRLGGSR